jgi:predicted nuclease of restriction endonuclease-like (RecB) superfamily
MVESGNVSLQAIRLIKAAILKSRYMAARLANKEQLKLYYAIGKYVSENSRAGKWGTGSIETISNQLQQELPGLKGFSVTNIRYMRLFFEAWSPFFADSKTSNHHLESDDLHLTSNHDSENQLITESGVDLMALSLNHHLASDDLKNFMNVGFTHHREILGKTNVVEERLFYINHCAVGFWSVETLKYHLREDLFAKQSNTLNNFNLSISQKDIRAKALHSFKDEYLLDYINLEDPDDSDERVVESAIVSNIKHFIMSFGDDFCFMGNQYRIIINEKEVFIDLLFFHRTLNCLVAIELKRGDFKPAYSGQLNFYLSALDEYVKHANENPSIGIILCKGADEKFVQLSVRDVNKPIGVATYKTANDLPTELKNVLPNLDELKKLLQ